MKLQSSAKFSNLIGNLKKLMLQNEPPKKEREGFSKVLLKRTRNLMLL